MTRKQAYLSLCIAQPVEWLRGCANEPSPYMTRMHVAIVLLAIRMKASRA